MKRGIFIPGLLLRPVLLLLLLVVSNAYAQNATVSVLDFGATPFAQTAADKLRTRLRSLQLTVADADMTRAAATGGAYSGSLNLSVSEARDLGA
ncbi:MAG TPA: hypothetical protein VFB65_10545, partial [Pyrinomonadaceae bacterium]|nr:hypothetical protein [Pyrinomonadaceae bacterium]